MNIYSLIDFWMKEICNVQRRKKNLSLSYKDIKGKDDLDAFQKYLTVYAGIDLNAVQDSFKHLDGLRMVRNRFIHNGGHVPDGEEKKYTVIDGISLSMSLIAIDDAFVWNTLDHAKKYLRAAAIA